MKTILITDTHFGVKQNSVNWLNSQLEFIEDQLIPYIQKLSEKPRLIHLGDVFDSRSTISTFVATKVIEVFKKLSEVTEDFIIIGGNHDFYSPNSDQIDTLNLLLGNLGIKIITKQCEIQDDNIYVPWYEWINNQDGIQQLINKHNIKNLFTHTDIVSENVTIRCDRVFSGHVHIPYVNGRLWNLGSTYALNFADANQARGFYVKHEDDKVDFIENEKSFKFWRFKNDEIFDIDRINKNDYVEIYISRGNYSLTSYEKQLDYISKNWKNLWIIPVQDALIDGNNNLFECPDIEQIAKASIPEYLQDKFNLILNSLK
ncbi:MAG: metallophosphoesterase family protein [Parabacteroides sp.]|nr:metallophosphoesterase family protein [Parabacteroides sp.]